MDLIIHIPEEDFKHLAYADHFKLRSYIESGEPLSKVVENIKTEIKEEINRTWYTKDSYQEGYKDGLLKANRYIDKYISEEEGDAE